MIIYNVLYQLVWTGTSESTAASLALNIFMESIAPLDAIVALNGVIMYMAVEFYKVMLNFFNYCKIVLHIKYYIVKRRFMAC